GEAETGGNSVGADSIPNRDALDDRRRAVFGHLPDQAIDVLLVRFALLVALPVVVPDLLQLIEACLPWNAADGADDAGKRARRVGAAREAEDVDFIGRVTLFRRFPIE